MTKEQLKDVLKYQKGSRASNFNLGEQFGMGLTITF